MKIAVYTIAKNEERNVKRWLETTDLADVRVVADTGSTDWTLKRFQTRARTPLILSSITLEPFRFDDARNMALAMVPADVDVCVSLDMDEILHPGWRAALEKAWVADRQPGVSGWVTFKYDETLTYPTNTRVHSRHGWRWKYPYHEAIVPSMTQVTMALDVPGLTIEHRPPLVKGRPNIALRNLAWGLFENPTDPRMLHYYGRELMWSGFTQDAIEKFVAFLATSEQHDREQVEAYLRQCHDQQAAEKGNLHADHATEV